MVTANQELVQIKHSMVFGQYGGQLVFPSDWVPADQANLEMPSEADLVTPTVGKKYSIGTQYRKGPDLYRYSKAGETIAIGHQGFLKVNGLSCPGVSSTGGDDSTAFNTDAAAGDTAIDLANTNSRAKNFYEGAAMWVQNDTLGIIDKYRIIASDVYASAAHVVIYIAPPGLKRAHTTTSGGVHIYLSQYAGVKSGLTGGGQLAYHSAIGMAHFPITTGYYFWLHTAGEEWGTGASTWPGQTAYYRGVFANVDGSLIGYVAGYQRVGFLLAGTASDYGDVYMMLDLDQ